MNITLANGLNLEYESYGPEDGESILLVMGVGGQLTLWPLGFVDLLVQKGFRLIRYDARDVGLSDKLDGVAAYSLDDLAADAVGLLDALGIRAAHIVGGSMGGMVAQLIAINHPEHVRTLTSIMSSTGNPDLPGPSPELIQQLLAPAPDPHEDLDAFLDHQVANAQLTQSPDYPTDPQELRAQFASDFNRSHYPDGALRHQTATFAATDRRTGLRAVSVPTLVIHGEADPLIPVAAGRDTAESIPGARLLLIPGMGHDLAPQLLSQYADAIVELASGA
ncbi:alpha/beta fold hydrolase [Kribbella sp. NPDC051587]|uniref:alpha/beta fold hydrolase n=1 Tax=Kribbella sp. NPDC051587 TaxID=3364119 RepID=UPI00379A2E3C